MNNSFSCTTHIHAGAPLVWRQLTDAQCIAAWMSDIDMQLEIATDWSVHSPFIMRGNFHGPFENKGTILAYENEKLLSYTHLSSISELEDQPENYTLLEFMMTPAAEGKEILLELRVSNFPTDVIRKHLELYWPVTLQKIKEHAEHEARQTSSL